MNKKIKYMGITIAALLLTAGPVIAPIETTNVHAATSPESDYVKPDASYTDNGDGTYTLHGVIHGSILTSGENAHPTGNGLTVSLDGIKVSSTGTVNLAAPEFDGYKPLYNDYEVDLEDNGDVYFAGLMYQPTNATTINENKKSGQPYSTTITLTKPAITCDDTGLPNSIPGTTKFVTLPAGSSWKVDRKMYNYEETYYRVGTNTWVDSRDGNEESHLGVVTTKNQSALFTKDGTKIANRVLGANTAWLTDQTATINGQTMYRVATNEWLASRDVK
ncbi:SLAP domain-containing protein [Companilactobacillus bobalius]|uniref:S-layer protein C-terminal domain-containing protein n=2 Tax=Companilactobacillus bobalius TaxID=2801451 RepID=A0A202FGC2_9LACO|nr:SLAP domain-containing protein [Companilactobacillus bobalius]KAE9560151.1 hypothetical protein ATN92_07955 [Companilactobacillus bobalius]OVE99491.1 hypothetical protein LKACC16343_00604 [Companilactobacillus bobalius]GEO57471.1 hypothetical protein LBO01_06000 [Companilactobacillus paralimentarius]